MSNPQDTDALRIAKAKEVKAVIDQAKPVTEWRMTASIRTTPRGPAVYVCDRKGKYAAILTIDEDGNVSPAWMPGHSMTRNELRVALGVTK